jgi:hydrogenase nickel incorporation protein HypB
VISLEARLLEKNRLLAERNRGWFAGRGVVALNLMSSPGAGRTTLLEKTLRALDRPAAVIEGDQATDRDAARIRATGVEAVQVNTGTGCHLEADMVWHALERLPLRAGSVLFIENVGNLVCPALFDLGERAKVVLFSVTEGEDKPLKYPHMFRAADLVLLTKVDLLPFVEFDVRAAEEAVATVKPGLPMLRASAKTDDGMADWLRWLDLQRV